MVASFVCRTPLHLAACNGNTAALEYLLKQETVLINAVDRFGGTPYVDAIREFTQCRMLNARAKWLPRNKVLSMRLDGSSFGHSSLSV